MHYALMATVDLVPNMEELYPYRVKSANFDNQIAIEQNGISGKKDSISFVNKADKEFFDNNIHGEWYVTLIGYYSRKYFINIIQFEKQEDAMIFKLTYG